MTVKDDDDDDAPAAPAQKEAPVKLEHDKPAKAPSLAKPAKAPALGPKSAPQPKPPPPPKKGTEGLFAKAAAAKKAAEAFRQRRQRVNLLVAIHEGILDEVSCEGYLHVHLLLLALPVLLPYHQLLHGVHSLPRA